MRGAGTVAGAHMNKLLRNTNQVVLSLPLILPEVNFRVWLPCSSLFLSTTTVKQVAGDNVMAGNISTQCLFKTIE